MKDVKPDNYIIMWNSNSDFQECLTLENALTAVRDLIDNDQVSPDDLTLYACTEVPLDVTIQSKVEVKK